MPFDSTSFQTETKPEVLEPWRQVLLDAADLLEREGWANLSKHDSGLCVYRAIKRIVRTYDVSEAQRRLALHVGAISPTHGLYSWNDTPGRTKEEVLTALRECARS